MLFEPGHHLAVKPHWLVAGQVAAVPRKSTSCMALTISYAAVLPLWISIWPEWCDKRQKKCAQRPIWILTGLDMIQPPVDCTVNAFHSTFAQVVHVAPATQKNNMSILGLWFWFYCLQDCHVFSLANSRALSFCEKQMPTYLEVAGAEVHPDHCNPNHTWYDNIWYKKIYNTVAIHIHTHIFIYVPSSKFGIVSYKVSV